MEYKHTQTGTLILVVLAIGALGMAIFTKDALNSNLLLGFGALVIVGILFGTLTVRVAGGKLRCWFGPGLIFREFSLTEITKAEAVRNRWYYGWGIRYTPHGWLFNVSGLDAVEIALSSGKQFRIGTNEPVELERAIRRGAGLYE